MSASTRITKKFNNLGDFNAGTVNIYENIYESRFKGIQEGLLKHTILIKKKTWCYQHHMASRGRGRKYMKHIELKLVYRYNNKRVLLNRNCGLWKRNSERDNS